MPSPYGGFRQVLDGGELSGQLFLFHGAASLRVVDCLSHNRRCRLWRVTRKRSRLAVVLTGVYVLFGIFALAVAVTTAQETPLAAIFLVLAALPWGFVLTRIVDATGIQSLIFNYAFMAAGIAVNAALLYGVISWIHSKRR